MRELRDFRPQQLYGVTQRGNRGQWVYRDTEDFLESMRLMDRASRRYEVRIHGWCLMHNHGHWIFEASSAESISHMMRDMQGQYSRYLNKKYADRPDLLLAPLMGARARRKFSKFLRAGPVNWTPRFDAVPLDAAGYREFLRYVENNPVRAKLVKKAVKWEWSSAAAHCAGVNAGGRLCLDQWQHLFGNPATITVAWREYLEGPAEELRRNTARLAAQIPYNRPLGWLALRQAEVERSVAASPG